MLIGRIPPSGGIEVFPNDGGTISVKQDDWSADDNAVVAVHPEDVDYLIQLLQQARAEIRRSNELGEAVSAETDADGNPRMHSID